MCGGTREELRGGGEDGRDGREGDGMVGEVDEAGGLETVQDGGGCGLSLGGGAIQEEGEVNQLGMISWVCQKW